MKRGTQKYQRRLSLSEIEDKKNPRKLSKTKNKYKNEPSGKHIRKSIQYEKSIKEKENHIIVDVVNRLYEKFNQFQKKVKYEDDVDDIKDIFQSEMCRDNLFSVRKTFRQQN